MKYDSKHIKKNICYIIMLSVFECVEKKYIN